MTRKENARMRMPRNGLSWFGVAILAACLAPSAPAVEGLRRIQVGEILPEFTLTGVDGAVFAYKHERARVLGILILQAGQSNSERAMAEVKTLAQELAVQSPAFDCIGVVCGPNGAEFIRTHSPGLSAPLFMAPDPNFAFWGRLGVIAAPTAAVVGSDGRVQWVRAGYGFDFSASLHAQLRKALGLADSGDAAVHVETLENASTHARQDRLVQMARMLVRKGRTELAAAELQKAYDLDPNAVEVALELGELLCRTGKNEAALKVATAARAKTNPDRARSLLIRGWASRQMKQLDAAESLLKSALELNPKSARVLYELGRVYESLGSAEKALACYRGALAEVFEETGVPNSSQE